ncbi:carbohydrate ABC transporter permease [Streptomyces sp. VRA16 Mangrove soil]|uniref:carbohydrate ABC transporter permease n=1 Tax=Streptomyces sp. VRA16 Mangrove soil TaxID=2817434 RepID=UPI001A9D327E|nr:carbohydrate ABC transporter permease [Streptomyces sp. VRA16 Mangrove soil]MBO1330738.1 carbohydrate ABC transporter permease [Streptomyces sp. VRA16 Mangrove soil]
MTATRTTVTATRAPWLRPLVVTVLGCVFAVPLYVVLANAFKQGSDIAPHPANLPLPPTLDNLTKVVSRPDHLFWVSLTNSLVVTTLSVIVLTVLSAMLGHYLARTASRWGKAATLVLLCGLMIPPQVILLPLTQVLRTFDLMATVQGLVLFNVGYYVPFGVFVFAGFVKGIPVELEQAAAIDGAGWFRTFWQVVFPLLRPATASSVIFFGVWIWNDFLNPLIILGPGSGTTVTTGIYRAIGQYQADFGTVFGLMLLATLPVLVLYLVLQKQFVKGLTGGATKG